MRRFLLILAVFYLGLGGICKAEQVLQTIAGNGNLVAEPDADLLNVLQIPLVPGTVVADDIGNLVFCDFITQRILAVSLTTGQPFNVGGNGTPGFSGDGGPARDAQFNTLGKLGFDPAGNVIVSDTFNHRIRKIDVRTGIVTTIAGNGTAGFAGDGGQAVDAQINQPSAVAYDASGNLFIADSGNFRVRVVLADGRIFTVAGTGASEVNGDGGLATAAGVGFVNDLAFTPQGQLIIASGDLRLIDFNTGVITSVSFGFDASGRRYFLDSITFHPNGDLYAVSFFAGVLFKVEFSGVITKIAGGGTLDDGAPAVSTLLPTPTDLAIDQAGNIYVATFIGLQLKKVSEGSVTVAQDNDRDGFSNSIETAAGTSPENAASSPFGTTIHTYNFSSIDDVVFKLNFKRVGKDSVTVKGFYFDDFPLTDGMTVLTDFGGVARMFTLNKRGKSVKSSPDSLAIKFVPKRKPTAKKGRTIDVYEFKLKLSRKDFVNALKDEGVVPNATPAGKRAIVLTTLVGSNATIYFERAFVSFDGRKGKGSGPARVNLAGRPGF